MPARKVEGIYASQESMQLMRLTLDAAATMAAAGHGLRSLLMLHGCREWPYDPCPCGGHGDLKALANKVPLGPGGRWRPGPIPRHRGAYLALEARRRSSAAQDQMKSKTKVHVLLDLIVPGPHSAKIDLLLMLTHPGQQVQHVQIQTGMLRAEASLWDREFIGAYLVSFAVRAFDFQH